MSNYPSVDAKQICKVLEGNGFELVRSKGSHHQFKKDGFPLVITVPFHGSKDISKGTVKGIIRDIGMTEEDFYRQI